MSSPKRIAGSRTKQNTIPKSLYHYGMIEGAFKAITGWFWVFRKTVKIV